MCWRRASATAFAALTAVLAMPLAAAGAPLEGIHKIQHVVVIMQENRSFDSYFGTYPGANGIPAGVCEPDPLNGGCVAPFHDPNDRNYGGPHGHRSFTADLGEGRMDGFIGQAEQGRRCKSTEPSCSPCTEATSAKCIDVMGYHDAREIPNYWAYAENFVLQDSMYEPNSSWSWPEHLYQVSAWSAVCEKEEKWIEDPLSCVSSVEGPPSPERRIIKEGKEEIEDPYIGPKAISLPWTDITYLLHGAGVSWAYYVFEGTEPDCESNEAVTCKPKTQGPKTASIWNPLPDFRDVKEDHQLENVQTLKNFYTTVHEQGGCGLPNVSWIDPNSGVSEHPSALISKGQAYVTTLINAIMRSPCWTSTAVFLSWDDWGGFYDHVVPPNIDENGYGLRVPGLVISPYAKAGYVDHQQLSHDAYLKFIEDDFLNGNRLNPKTDGRPDSRPSVREEAPGLGNLAEDFEFNQAPRPPLILQTQPAPGPASKPPGYVPPPVAPPPVTPPSTVPPPTAPVSALSSTAGASRAVAGVSGAGTASLLQIIASVATRQDMRLHHGRIYLTIGCNAACALYAHGHLNLLRRHRHLGLRSARAALAAHSTALVALSLSRSNLAAVRRALHGHRSVEASIEVGATGANGQRQSYQVSVTLSWR
jgi:phospholipase C